MRWHVCNGCRFDRRSVLAPEQTCPRCGGTAPPLSLPHCGHYVIEVDPARVAPYAVALWLAAPPPQV